MERVVLVDEQDNETGLMEKQQAHIEGKLHRAISVFVFNTKHELLLQQRAGGKYHSALQWTNTCCSHPRSGEDVGTAAARRLMEEMGISCTLTPAFTFVYRAELGNGLTEHEFDHVFTGICDDPPVPDNEEVADWKYIAADELQRSIAANPGKYTPWFRLCVDNHFDSLFTKSKI